MSNPKEKAKELYDLYRPKFFGNSAYKSLSKQCAIIAVDEIIINMNDLEKKGKLKEGFDKFQFWLDVKKEIELL